jgi:hypothetical protein
MKKMCHQKCILLAALLLSVSLVTIPYHSVFANPFIGDNPPPPKPAGTKPGYEISIRGGDAFIVQTRAALNLLAQCAPEALKEADDSIDTIQEFNRSGMEVDTGTFLASNTTAFAPGYRQAVQIFWYAGTIVHDAHHRTQEQNGIDTNWGNLSEEQRETLEADARSVQIATLQQCLPFVQKASRTQAEYMIKYLTDMQSVVSECDYCKIEWENRNW